MAWGGPSQSVLTREVERALQTNLTRLRARIVRSPTDLSSDLVQEALGKLRSHQAMWGILSSLLSGLQITPGDGRVDYSVRHLCSLKAAISSGWVSSQRAFRCGSPPLVPSVVYWKSCVRALSSQLTCPSCARPIPPC